MRLMTGAFWNLLQPGLRMVDRFLSLPMTQNVPLLAS